MLADYRDRLSPHQANGCCGMSRRYDDSGGASERCGASNHNEDVTIDTSVGEVIAIQTRFYSTGSTGDLSLTVRCLGAPISTEAPEAREIQPIFCGDTVTVNVAGNNDFWPFMLDLSLVPGATQVDLYTCASAVRGRLGLSARTRPFPVRRTAVHSQGRTV